MKKETATQGVKIYPSTHRRLKIRAARENTNVAALIEKYERLAQLHSKHPCLRPSHSKII